MKKDTPARSFSRRKLSRDKKVAAFEDARRAVEEVALAPLTPEVESLLASLSPQRRLFVLLYAHADSPVRFDARAASTEAGYSPESPVGSQLLTRHADVARAANLVAADTTLGLFETVRERREFARAQLEGMLGTSIMNFGHVTPEGGFRVDLRKMKGNPWAALTVNEVTVDERVDALGQLHTRTRVKLESRLKTLELYLKHVDVSGFVEKVEVDDGVAMAERIRDAQKRVRQLRERTEVDN